MHCDVEKAMEDLCGRGGDQAGGKVGSERGVQCSQTAALAEEAGSSVLEPALLPLKC